MNTINTIGLSTFELNGIERQKVFLAVQRSLSSIEIVCAYDSRIVILKNTDFDDIIVNGVIHSTLKDLIATLNPVMFTNNIIESGGSPVSTSNTLKFTNSTDGIIHTSITGALNIDPTGQVNGGMVEVKGNWDENPAITLNGNSSSLIRSDSGSETITESGDYTIFIHYDGTFYNVNIRKTVIYTGTGTGGGGTGETAPILTTSLSGQTETAPILTTNLS